ncbi:tetratricopeptide repeat protein [Oceanicaulis sp. LC35]|uniref:tetratricopeptide repeat protein n=1 Tax=Oceanicaulis sp. LC35 TaxID=3349635 RepID=UPI003F861DD0
MILFILITAIIGAVAAWRLASPFLNGTETGSGRIMALVIVPVVLLGALGFYFVNGEPEEPGAPYASVAQRLAETDPEQLSPDEQEARLRAILRENPEDLQALTLLGRFLSRSERELEAVTLFTRALQIEEDPRILSDLGQALVVLNDGQVTPEAERAFEAANQLDPTLPEPAFFLGAAYYARGERNEAAAVWSDIIARLDDGDPFRAAIAARAADLLSRPQGGPGSSGAAPFADAIAAGVDPADLAEMMVSRLETRLEEDPDDLSGWLTLARARWTQGQAEAGLEALEQASARFEGDAGALALISAMRTAFAVEESEQ